jgi:hypothetical protein
MSHHRPPGEFETGTARGPPNATRTRGRLARTAGGPSVPAAVEDDPTGVSGGWYRAPAWRASGHTGEGAARRTGVIPSGADPFFMGRQQGRVCHNGFEQRLDIQSFHDTIMRIGYTRASRGIAVHSWVPLWRSGCSGAATSVALVQGRTRTSCVRRIVDQRVQCDDGNAAAGQGASVLRRIGIGDAGDQVRRDRAGVQHGDAARRRPVCGHTTPAIAPCLEECADIGACLGDAVAEAGIEIAPVQFRAGLGQADGFQAWTRGVGTDGVAGQNLQGSTMIGHPHGVEHP